MLMSFLFSNCSRPEIENVDSGTEAMNYVFEKALDKYVPNETLDVVPHDCAYYVTVANSQIRLSKIGPVTIGS